MKTAFIVSFIIGIGGSILFGSLFYLDFNSSYIVSDYTWYDEVFSWLSIPYNFFLSFTFLIIPFYLFLSIIKIVFATNSKFTLRAFFNVWIYSFIGILVALIIFPLIKLVSVPSTEISLGEPIDGNIGDLIRFFIPNTIGIFASKIFLLSIIILGFVVGFVGIILKKKNKETANSFISFIDNFKVLIDFAFSKMIYLVPFVIFSWMPLIFSGESLLYIDDLIRFIAVFLIGLYVIYLIQLAMLRVSKRKSDYSSFNRFTFSSMFTSSNGIIPQFEKQNEDVLSNSSKLILSLSTTSGQSISSGYFPTFMILLTLSIADKNIDWITIIEIVVLVSLFSFITVGVMGGDYITSIFALSVFTLPMTYIATIFMIEPVIYPFKSFVNTNGIITNAYRNNIYR